MRLETPRVTIITPAYNAARFIGRCLQSALDQSFTDWEQIVVDDGSSDRTAEIVRGFADPRIRLVELPHRGLGALADTYNAALAMARGELIGVLEGDDAWLPHKLELQVPAFDEPDVVVSWGRAFVIDGAGRIVRRWPLPRVARRDYALPDLFRLLARWNVLSPALTVMVRRSALELVGGFRQTGSSLYVDLPTWLAVSAHVAGRARYLERELGLYRIYDSNTGTVHNSRMRLEHQDVVAQTLRGLSPARLRTLGWDERHERRTRVSAILTRAIAHHQQGDRQNARAAFAATLRQTRSIREFAVALLGLLSGLTRLDLVGAVQSMRYAAASLLLQVSRPARKAG